jgi:diguanylate cyclase (GGDEF)-like protein/PAS domain S-box-containing protein
MWTSFAANLAATALFVCVFAYLASDLTAIKRTKRAVITGATMGAASIVSMLTSVEMPGGAIADLRSVPIAAAGYFGGPIAALVAAALAAACRIYVNGSGTLLGLVGIAITSGVGVAGYYLTKKQPRFWHSPFFAAAVATVPLSPLLFLGASIDLTAVLPPLVTFNFIGALLAALAVSRGARRADERQLLLAAIHQSPDYVYLKDTEGRLVAMNQSVLDDHGAGRPSELRGRTDLDLFPGERGEALFAEEQQLLESAGSIDDKIEKVLQPDGSTRWYETSKSAILDVDERVIGLVGITKDITEDQMKHLAIETGANQLSLVLSEMASGVALFDLDLRLLFCNEQYHQMFSLTRDVRVPGVRFDTILRTAVERAEQVPVPADTEAWVAEVVDLLKTGGEEEVRLADGRALMLRNRTVRGIGYVCVVSVITEIRRTEAKLAIMTEQLRILATTDALTGLTNRRALDDMLDREVARSRRSRAWLSLVMIDVDQFKAFNDLYGHPEGDRCLQLVAQVLRTTSRRVPDVAARYGGEEFCLVLPETDEQGAYDIAEAVRLGIQRLGRPHAGGEAGVVTVSLGIASYGPDDTTRSASELIGRADAALYAAKASGRNRVYGWSDRTARIERAG